MTFFFRSLSGAEAIDDTLPPGAFEGKQRADFLLDEGRIIVELKTLKTDTSAKVEAEIEKHRERDDFPLFYASAELQEAEAVNKNETLPGIV